MARITAVFDDLLLGSNVAGALKAAGHDVELVGAPDQLADDAGDVLVVDLGSSAFDGVALVERLRLSGGLRGARTLGVYSHVEHDVRLRAEAAGFDLVVPRSRMAREGPALVQRLTAPAGG